MTRAARQPMPALEGLIAQYPEITALTDAPLTELEVSLGWKPFVQLSSQWVKTPQHAAELMCQKLLSRLEVPARYEPLLFSMQMRSGGIPRGFQPDFWLTEDCLLIELAKRVEAKNMKVIIMAERWPSLPVLVVSDAQLAQLAANEDLTAEDFRRRCSNQLARQAKRIRREGSDPHGYRRLGAEIRRAQEAGEPEPSKWQPWRIRLALRRRWLNLLR